jgi:hypothetical protein
MHEVKTDAVRRFAPVPIRQSKELMWQRWRIGMVGTQNNIAVVELNLGLQPDYHRTSLSSSYQRERCASAAAQGLVVAFACLHVLSARFIQPVSRRLVNLAYVCWQLWFHLLVLSAFQLLQLLVPSRDSLRSAIDMSLSRHALLFFVLSNLGTGAVNVSMWTRKADDATALCILLLYIHSVVLVVHIYAVNSAGSTARHHPSGAPKKAEL